DYAIETGGRGSATLSGARPDLRTLRGGRFIVYPGPRVSALGNPHGHSGDLRQPDGGRAPDHHPRGIELEPAHARLGGAWLLMVVVVQALPARHPGEGAR